MVTASTNAQTSRSLSAAQVREDIFEDHRRIRALLECALDVAGQEVSGNPAAHGLLPHLLYGIGVALERHLAFEEAILLPLLEDDLPIGPQRAAALREEHTRQRAEIARLAGGALADDIPLLVTNLRRLAADFLKDMAEEERYLLQPDVLRDDLLVIDQCTG